MDQKQCFSVDLKDERSNASGDSRATTIGPDQQQQPAVKPKIKPAIPPKPPIDINRFSMANMEESTDVDLDALLSELCALESQLNSNGPDSLFGKWTKKPPMTRPTTSNITPANSSTIITYSNISTPNCPNVNNTTANSANGVSSVVKPVKRNGVISTTTNSNGKIIGEIASSSTAFSSTPKTTVSIVGNNSNNNNVNISNAEKTCIIDQQQNSVISSVASSSSTGAKLLPQHQEVLHCRAQSPDNDSAYCDSASLTSSESILSSTHRCRDSHGSSADSTRGSMTTPSPTQLIENVQAQIRTVQEEVKKENLTDEEQSARVKAEKIKIALEKMKEASVKKLYIKVFSLDGSSKSILVDERWTVDYILGQLAEKNHVPLLPTHALVESYPDLFMERIFEDHELVVENITMWTRDSSNKLYFVERSDKYDMFYNPQIYLVSETSYNKTTSYDTQAKQQLITEFFTPSHVQPPELAGILHLKADGKKSWKKHYFVLRASGLYYYPKGKTKSSKDLVCLMQFETVQIYNGIGWKKKYKAPTDFGFALKHPRIQVKASKYVKYLCVEDERSYQRWMTGLRLAKNGRQLFENFVKICDYPESSSAEVVTPTASTNGYYKESVVMRPKSTNNNGSLTDVSKRHSTCSNSSSNNNSSSEVYLSNNPSSVVSINALKRNSRSSLIHVDLPMVPENAEERSLKIDTFSNGPVFRQNSAASPTMSYRSAVNSAESTATATNSDSQTPTPETQSINGFFESDFPTTGTIKRQPFNGNFVNGTLKGTPIQLPLPPPPPVQPRHHNVAPANRYESLETLSLSGSGNGDEAEIDSDEELPPPPPPHCDLFSAHQMAPPSPRMSTSTDGSGAAAVVVTRRSSRNSVDSTTSYQDDDTKSLGGNRPKRLPPAPPKRNDATRLSTVSMVTTPSPVDTPSSGDNFQQRTSFFSNEPVSPRFQTPVAHKRSTETPPGGGRESPAIINNGVAVFPGTRPKPALPAKPKLSAIGQQNSPCNIAQAQLSPVPSIPAATDAFNNELQRAMQRRLLKMQEAEITEQQKSA